MATLSANRSFAKRFSKRSRGGSDQNIMVVTTIPLAVLQTDPQRLTSSVRFYEVFFERGRSQGDCSKTLTQDVPSSAMQRRTAAAELRRIFGRMKVRYARVEQGIWYRIQTSQRLIESRHIEGVRFESTAVSIVRVK